MKRLVVLAALVCCTPTAVYEPAPPQPAEPKTEPAKPSKTTLPTDLVAKLEHHAICSQTSCASDRLYPPTTMPDPQAPAAMWSQVIENGAKLRISPSERADLYGVVISGSVSLESDKKIELPAWRAFHAPNAGVTLSGNGSLVMAIATDGEPVRKAIAGREPVKVAPGPVELVDFDSQTELSWAGGKARARLGFERGRASFGLLMSDADAPVPEHDHPKEWEVIALLRADGRFKRGDKPGAPIGEGEEVTAARVVAVPIGVRHAWAPSGKQELFAVQMYSPPGPEQRFKDLAAKSTSSAASAPRTEPFVGVWRIDAQAHFDKAGSDPVEKRLALVIVRSQIEMVIGADSRFEMRTTREPSVLVTARWQLQRTDGKSAWLLVDNLSPAQEKPTGMVRLVLRDADHLEYYKQIGDPPQDDLVVFYVRAKK